MNDITVKLLADKIQTSVENLIKQFANAGIVKFSNDLVTEKERKILLSYLNHEYDLVPDRLTLQRKTRSTLNIPGSSGKSRLVKIEVRKIKTFIKDSIQNEEIHAIEKKICPITIKNNNQINRDKNNTKKENIRIIETKKENKNAKLKYKTKKKEYQMIEKNVEKDFKSSDRTKKTGDYHITFPHQILTKDNYLQEIEEKHSRNRNSRTLSSQKKINKYLELKINQEENQTITRTANKISRHKNSILQQSFQKPIHNISRNIIINETITINELANKMAVKSSQVIKSMMKLGIIATINQVLNQKTAQLVAEEMGHRVILHRENELEEAIMKDRDMSLITEPRAPVVTIMGHVDHGKTSLLDYIRSTKVAFGEAGGITQHIGAYHVKTDNGIITFLDTPGHAAFTAMRARGVKVTDIIVLVVAVDDGVMPQTIEAIQHAKAANLPIVVAINKLDKPGINIDKVKNELTKYDIIPEEWGGDCQFVYVSAKTGIGIEELLNAILLQAEILELRAVRNGMARGTVIESFIDKGRGPTASVLIREGTIKKGDAILCGLEYGRIRAIRNELGHEIIEAGPSIPVEILGLSGIPIAGDEITVVRDEKKAREVALYRQKKVRNAKLANQHKSKLENAFTNLTEKEAHKVSKKSHEINVIIKADVQGSVEAISDFLLKMSINEIKVKIIGSGVGSITETDAILATASNAILIGFNVRADASARCIIESENLDIRYYSVIYNLIDDIKLEMGNILSPNKKRNITGLAEVRNVFKSPKFGVIAGCMVIEGIIKRHSLIHILRNNLVIYEGELGSLRRFKDDVNEVSNSMECGIGIKNYSDIQIGDIIKVFEIVEVRRNFN